MPRAFEGENMVRWADGTVFYPPIVTTGPKDTGPTCGRCGTPWQHRGSGRENGYEYVSWDPRCFCWQDGKLTNAASGRDF